MVSEIDGEEGMRRIGGGAGTGRSGSDEEFWFMEIIESSSGLWELPEELT